MHREAPPDEEDGIHLVWLAEKLGRTPYNVACNIAALRHMPEEGKDRFRRITDDIRRSGLHIRDDIEQKGLD
jgi:hypothetical protein